jgi:hypothetical protein
MERHEYAHMADPWKCSLTKVIDTWPHGSKHDKYALTTNDRLHAIPDAGCDLISLM